MSPWASARVQISNPSLAAVAIGTGTATATIMDNDASTAPSLQNNAWTIVDGGTLSVTPINVRAADADTPVGTLVFSVVGVTNGVFDLAAGIGTPAPTLGGGGGTAVTPPTPPLASSAAPTALPTTTLATFFRPGGGGDGAEGDAVTFIEARPVPAALVVTDRVATPDSLIPPVRVQADVIETTPLRANVEIEPIRAEMQAIPPRHGLDLDEEERQRIDVVLNSVRITGLALSVGGGLVGGAGGGPGGKPAGIEPRVAARGSAAGARARRGRRRGVGRVRRSTGQEGRRAPRSMGAGRGTPPMIPGSADAP